MAIKNKDGSTYQLTKPNPVMITQSIWKNNYTLYNFNKGYAIIPKKPLEIAKVEEPIVEADEIIQVWCLPATIKEHVDELYGQKYRKVHYGKKFIFEAVLVEQTDLAATFWTNTKTVTQESILFPRINDKRWWQVKSIQQETEGYLLSAIISEHHPDFS